MRAKAQLGNNIFGSSWMIALLVLVIVSAINGILDATGIGAVVSLLVSGPLSFGLAYLFLKQTRDGLQMDIADLFKGFSVDFTQNFLIALMTTIFTLLWSLLFIIPGIVKYYAYSMVYFIKVDHPEYDWRRCIGESKAMTAGHKGELFVLDLSFLGWYIVGLLCLGIGVLWVAPYHQATRSQFYESLKVNAVYVDGVPQEPIA